MVNTVRSFWRVGAAVCVMAALVACQAGAKGHAKQEKNADEGEVKVTMAECPPAVQETLKASSAGGTIKEIVKEEEGGKLIYSADAVIGGKTYEINVAA